jgi:phosphatidylglycerophosphate synthase
MIYRAVDRSLLLPLYKRLLVEPFLGLIPDGIHPNTITHAGHLLNLLGTATLLLLWPEGGWPFALASLTLQLYCWCDNIDGPHARRTRQSSGLGEFLDHGLDAFSISYIALLTCMCVNAPPHWWVLMAVLIPGLPAVILWEQSVTGVFRLGVVNQIETLSVLSAGLMASAIFGAGVWTKISYAGITLAQIMLGWTSLTIVAVMLQGLHRVWRVSGTAALFTYAPMPAVQVLVVAAGLTRALDPVAAVALGISTSIFIGIRMLSWRVQSRMPEAVPLLWGVAVVLLGVLGVRLGVGEVPPAAAAAVVTTICTLCAALIALDMRKAIAALRHLDAAPSAPAASGGAIEQP